MCEHYRPLIIFDSGSGGLSVLLDLERRAPNLDYLYFADTANLPYGAKSTQFIQARLVEIAHELQQQYQPIGMVIACNTATSAGIAHLRAACQTEDFPIFGIEPAIKPAAAASQTHSIGVLVTEAMARSARYQQTVKQYSGKLHIITQPCPSFVPLIEQWLADLPEHTGIQYPEPSETLKVAIAQAIATIKQQAPDLDTLLLGCTHYNFIKIYINNKYNYKIIDSKEGLNKYILSKIKNIYYRNDIGKTFLAESGNEKINYKYKLLKLTNII